MTVLPGQQTNIPAGLAVFCSGALVILYLFCHMNLLISQLPPGMAPLAGPTPSPANPVGATYDKVLFPASTYGNILGIL